MDTVSPALLVRWLKAAGEPTRLRLLTLCAEGGMSVSDLAQVLRQSEPRVSRHLKILCEAGLIERQRQGQWVHYGVSPGAEAKRFVAGLLAQSDARDAQLARDRSEARSARAPELADASRLGRALAAFCVGTGLNLPCESVLVIGARHPELLHTAASVSRRCTALAHSRRTAQSLRAYAERLQLPCRILEATGSALLSETDAARAGAPFAAVLFDGTAAAGEDLSLALARVRAALQPGGRAWVFERYETLEGARQRVVEHPLARLRRLLEEAGLKCERLSPLEADGEHVLAAVGEALAHGALRAQLGAT